MNFKTVFLLFFTQSIMVEQYYIIHTGRVQLYGDTGQAVRVSSSGEVVLSVDVRGAMTFMLVACLAWNSISEALRPSCYSLMDTNSTDLYVRHDGLGYLRVDPSYNTYNLSLVELNSSFILHVDTFYPGHYALESVSWADWYINSHSDGRLGIAPRNNIADYRTASFRVYEYNTSGISTGLLSFC